MRDKNEDELSRRSRLAGAFIARIEHFKEDLGKRLAETRTLFDRKVLAVDIHTHSEHSDGWGTIDENHEAAVNVGLDFVFASDHNALTQKRYIRKWPDMSWGQEPATNVVHHIGLLNGRRLFRPGAGSLAATYEKALRVAPFVWIPHPTGWYWCAWYPDDVVKQLWTLGDAFAMEVLNGAAKCTRAFDQFDARAVQTWDLLLCEGKQVTPLGGSDAHCPWDIGTCWTGVYAGRKSAADIIAALKRGHCFASEASLVEFSCNGHPMGSTIRVAKGEALSFGFRVADSAGVSSVRIVSRGKVVKEIVSRKGLVEGSWASRASGRAEYFRLESTASDDRRAFAAPIYVRPT